MYQVKQLILWRHADAEMPKAGQTDMERALTAKGVKQAKQMAGWLKKNLPKQTLVVSSPALRALQTAEALSDHVEIADVLQPDTSMHQVMQYVTQSKAEQLLLVGHQPWLGDLIAHLLGATTLDLSVKKGAIWWLRLSVESPQRYQLYTLQTPQLIA
ncbi:MAG TPA: phosphohistidine phosphatase SixA [Methylophilus sp.]